MSDIAAELAGIESGDTVAVHDAVGRDDYQADFDMAIAEEFDESRSRMPKVAKYGFALLGVTLAALAANVKPAGAEKEDLKASASFDYTALPRSTTDRVDDFSGPQVKVVVATCKNPDGSQRDNGLDLAPAGSASFVDKSATRIQKFFSTRLKDSAGNPVAVRFDTYHGNLDVGYLPTDLDCSNLAFNSTELNRILAKDLIPKSSLYDRNADDIYEVYFDSPFPGSCGHGNRFQESGTLAPTGVAFVGDPNCTTEKTGSVVDAGVAFDIVRTSGLPIESHAAHWVFGGGVSDDRADLLFYIPAYSGQKVPPPGIYSDQLENLKVDTAHDDYYDDLANHDDYFGEPSVWTPPVPKNRTLEIDETGHGKVVATVKGIGSRVCKVSKCVFVNFIPPNKMVSLTATPAIHYKFGGWSDKRMEKTRTLAGTNTNRRIGARFVLITAQK